MFSNDELEILESLWDDSDENGLTSSTTGEISHNNSSLLLSSAATSATTSSTLQRLEEKLLSLASGADDIATYDTLVGEVQKANHKDLDALLANEMNRLSMKERDTVIQEIHGVAEDVTETPELIEQALRQLDEYLTKIPQKEAYDQALYLSPNYVQGRMFCLKFLRGTLFDAEKAACRLVRHFEEKLKLFGGDLLGRDILLSDLSDQDRKMLKVGTAQWLPIRDRAGRAVLCIPAMEIDPKKMRIMNRCLWYTTMAALEDEETQKNGIVSIIMNVGPNRISFDQVYFLRESQSVSEAMPHRVTSLHYCYDDVMLYPFVTFTRFILGNRVRGRFRIHFGKYTEYSYELMTYGIPVQFLPMDDAGVVLLEHHLDWLERRQVQESSASSSVHPIAAMVPRRFDVLLGRGPVSEHTGNLRAFHIVEMNRERYEKAGKFEKTQIAERIVHLIHQSYGRFLKKDRGGWVEVTTDEAREKISHCFRRLRELDRKRNPQATKRPPGKNDDTRIDVDAIPVTMNSDTTKRVKS